MILESLDAVPRISPWADVVSRSAVISVGENVMVCERVL